MNSSEPSETMRMGLLERVRASFDWIELFAVPIAICIMETQPIVLVLTFGATAFLNNSYAVPVSDGSITLLLLGLHWWAMAVSTLTQGRWSRLSVRLLQILGLFLAIAITVATHVSLLQNIPALIFTIVLIVGFWFAGMLRVLTGPNDTYVLSSFKIGLGILLGVLILTLFNFTPVPQVLQDELTRSLPTFFLSGLIGLSFTRIMLIRKENASSAQRRLQGDPTRVWLLILTVSWIVLMLSTFAFEIFGFQYLTTAGLLLWNGLGIVANWMLLLLAPLSRFFPLPRPIPIPSLTHPQSSNNGPVLPIPGIIEVILLLVPLLFLGLLLLTLLYLVIRTILRIWGAAPSDESDGETRESISILSALKARREEQKLRTQQTNTLATLESLDPTSARAHYRELLQELARSGKKLGRRATETPSEYEKRLLTLLKNAPSETQADGIPPDPAMLDELTSAYVQERYGGKYPHLLNDASLPAWIPSFGRRLADH